MKHTLADVLGTIAEKQRPSAMGTESLLSSLRHGRVDYDGITIHTEDGMTSASPRSRTTAGWERWTEVAVVCVTVKMVEFDGQRGLLPRIRR